MSRKVVLIDGNSLVYRAFFALPTTLTLASGQVINAVYGFTSMLIRLLIDEKPDVVAVAFDTRAPTWRHGHYEQYKAHRDPTPDDLISQFPLVKEVLEALAIPIFELDGFEADDLLATLTARARADDDEVLVVTGDRDAFQLITDEVRVMTTRRGITDIVIYDRAKVIERYGIGPEHVPDFLGLKGDPSDNIPGVPGIGDKTAAKLIQEFGGVESIYEHLDDVGSDKLRQSLIDNRELAQISKKLAVLNSEVPLEADLKDAKLGQWDDARVRDVFSRFEFRTLLERFEAKLGAVGGTPVDLLEPTVIEVSAARLKDELAKRDSAKIVGFDLVMDAAGNAAGLALGFDGKKRVESLILKIEDLSRDDVRLLRDWLKTPPRQIAVYDLKSKLSQAAAVGVTLEADFFDPFLAAYLLAPTDLRYELEHLCRHYLERELPAEGSLAESAAARAAASALLTAPLSKALVENDLVKLYEEIELPLSPVLARMEACGVGLDRDKLRKLSEKLGADLEVAAGKIYGLAGEEFNISSPQQVGKILFEKLGLKPGRMTKSKSGYATDAAVLAKLAEDHEIVPLILDFRELAKLKSTYVDALPKLVDPATGRLHTSFNQTVTATGRLSSSNPNLQNIPTRTELGRRIREAFIPAHKDEKLLAADYSQIELRLLAHLSGDDNLKAAFSAGTDIHTATAAEAFGVALDEVTPLMRRGAKAINFGIIYGMSPFGLSEQLGITTEEAKTYIDKYLNRYPAVGAFLEKTVRDAYKNGFVTTMSGRKRYMPELKSAAYNERSFGERVAVNAPLQGSAADIIKLAMINIDKYLLESGLQTRMVLQVHDELVFEVPPLEENAVTPVIKELMENAYPVSVPLEVNLSFGKNWGEAK